MIRDIALIPFPNVYTVGNGLSSMLLDAVGEKAAHVIIAPKTGNIDRVLFRTNTVTTGGTVDVRLETVDSSNNPTGTLKGTNTNASLAIADTDDNTWFEVTLTAAAAVTKGDSIAIVVVAPSGVNMNIGYISAFAGPSPSLPSSLPVQSKHYTTSWSFLGVGSPCAVRYDDGTYPKIPFVIPATTLSDVNASNTAAIREVGNKFTFPVRVRLWGACGASQTTFAAQSYNLYDENDNLVATTGTVTPTGTTLMYPFTSRPTLLPNRVYRICSKPETGTSNAFRYCEAPNSTHFANMPGDGLFSGTTRGTGAWTDYSTRFFAAGGVVIDGIEDTSSRAAFQLGV